MTKYRKGPTKDSQRTAKEHYGLSCRKLAPAELSGALYSSARQDFLHAAGLSCEPALSDSQSVCRGRPRHLWTWRFHPSSQSSKASVLRRWLEGTVRAAAAARPARCVLVGMRRRCCMARSNQHLLMAVWPSCAIQNPDAGKKLGSRCRPSADLLQVWQFSHDCRSSVVLCNAPLWSFAVFSHTLRFYARLHEVAAVHNAGIGMGAVDQQWHHCLLLFFFTCFG